MSQNKRHRNLFTLSLLAVVIPMVQGCHPQASSKPPSSQAISVSVSPANPIDVPITHDVVAYAEASKTVEVRARVGGILEQQVYADGAKVKAGQVLYKIDRVPLQIAVDQARADVMQSVAQSKQAIREENRMAGLYQGKSVSRKDYDDAVSTREMSQASLAASRAALKKAELDLSYANVVAPVDGIASRAEKSIGSLVTVGTDALLTSIVQIDPIWVNFALSQQELNDMGLAKVGAKGIDYVEAELEDGTIYPIKGHVDFIDSKISSTVSTIQMRVEFQNPEGVLLPGQFMKLKLHAGAYHNAVLVPQAAVMQSDQGRFVYTIAEGGKAAATPVEAGPWQGKEWVITGGLKAGDKVIVDNLIKLHPGADVSAKPAEQNNIKETK